ncbi:MAG: TonB family protein [Polyangiales bacterium]
MARKSMVALYGVSFALHASLGLGVTEIEPTKEPERVAITVVSAPKPKAKPKVEEPPPPPPPPPPVEAAPKRAAPKAKKAAPAQAAEAAPAAAAPSFGIAMTGGTGAGGIAVPQGDSLGGDKAAPKRVAEAKTLTEPKPKPGACAEPASKPKPLSMPRPDYTEAARAAAIEGKVRVELTVDASGAVKGAKVLESLGHGLDEAAIRAVQSATFEPAAQCGKPVSATFVVAIRFSL